MILSQKQRMKITWIFSETSLGSWSIKAKLHEGGYCGEKNRTNLILALYGNVSRNSPLAPSERFTYIELKNQTYDSTKSTLGLSPINFLIIRIANFRRYVVMFI